MKQSNIISPPSASLLGATSASTGELSPGELPNWRSYTEPLLPIGEKMESLMSESTNPRLRHELYRMIFMNISSAYMGLFLGDNEYPDFWPAFNQAYNWLVPNPDTTYLAAPLDEGGIYKISGYLGSVRITDASIASGLLVPRGIGQLAPVLSNYNLDSLKIDRKDGAFEVILSPERPSGYMGDWWKLEPDATYLLIRQASYDWLHEQDGRFAIERLDKPAIKPRMSSARISSNLHLISAWAENWTEAALRWHENYRADGLVNKVDVHDLKDIGGFATQQFVEGLFEIDSDEALIYETDVPQCRYWSLQVTDVLWSSIDWVNRQSSLNGFTAKLDNDGKFRGVISAIDPRVPNWLDTGGYRNGAMVGRWLECSSTLTPKVSKVKVAEVRNYLPPETLTVSAEERDMAIRLRRKGAQLRRKW